MKDFSIYGEALNFPSSLVMSGVESDAYFDIAIGEGIDRMLMSYHYIQRKGKSFLRKRLSKYPNVKMMIDSGAHTFHAKEEEFKDKPLEFWENYLERYTNFVRENKEFIFSCVELDIANMVGFEKVDYFRKKYFEPLKEEGILVCYVWHEYDGDKHWEEMCAKYDYVGFSLTNTNMSENEIVRKMNIARRYGAIVHGFAVTRTELMSRVPFFTGDSTTWLVGTQYGELNWFDGRKMKRLKKDKWKREYKQKYIKLGAKEDLFMEENPYELIRINLIVFKQAEEYIRKRIRGKSYWLKGLLTPQEKPKVSLRRKKIEGNSAEDEGIDKEEELVDNRPASKFEDFQSQHVKELRDLDEQLALLPDDDWFDTDCEDYKDFVQKLGIDINGNGKEHVVEFLFNASLFYNHPDYLTDYEPELIIQVAEGYTGKSFEDVEDAVIAIMDILRQNLTLETNSAFPRPVIMEMEAIEHAKERESYLEDDEYEIVDMDEEEVSLLLPPPSEDGSMPEVEELDAELARTGVVAIRDEKGRFLKGQKRVRKPKNIYSDKFPKLACNTCYKAGDCPEFKPDHVCAYDKIFKKFDVRNSNDIIDAMSTMVNSNLGRLQRQMLFETMDGGVADGTVTAMIDQNMNLLMKMQQLNESMRTPVATQHRVIHSDGSMQETTTVTNPSGGILSQIFGKSVSQEDKGEDDIIEGEIIE